jgi:hypothetical protein
VGTSNKRSFSTNPRPGVQEPKRTHVSLKRLPPEAREVPLILNAAVDLTPDIAAIPGGGRDHPGGSRAGERDPSLPPNDQGTR